MAGLVFAQLPWRSRDVENDLRSRCRQFRSGVAPVPALAPEILIVPDIFADRQANLLAVELDYKILVGRLEVAILVKNIVGRQQHFGASGQDFAVLAERRRISRLASGTGFISAHIADEQAGFGSRFGQALKEFEILRDELCLEQQIAWR